MYPNPSKEYHLFTNALSHTWSGSLTQQQYNSEIMVMKNSLTIQLCIKAVPSLLHNLNGLQL